MLDGAAPSVDSRSLPYLGDNERHCTRFLACAFACQHIMILLVSLSNLNFVIFIHGARGVAVQYFELFVQL